MSEHNAPKMQPEATEILRMIDDPEVAFVQLRLMREASIRELVRALQLSITARPRAILCYVLGKRHAHSAMKPLIGCLNDPASEVRNNAAEALAKLENSAAGAPVYEQFLVEADAGVKSSLAMALGSVNYRAGVPMLVRALKDADARVRCMAAWPLGELGKRAAGEALRAALETEADEPVRRFMREAIEAISQRAE